MRRIALVSFWEDDASLSAFEQSGLPAAYRGGWSVRLEPIRAFGQWPGLDPVITTSHDVEDVDPVVVLTLGKVKMLQLGRFRRSTSKAEAAALRRPGMIWAIGMSHPPVVGTVSLWRTTAEMVEYSYGSRDAAHSASLADNAKRPFHHDPVFVRFRPYQSRGGLGGQNPLAEDWIDVKEPSGSP